MAANNELKIVLKEAVLIWIIYLVVLALSNIPYAVEISYIFTGVYVAIKYYGNLFK